MRSTMRWLFGVLFALSMVAFFAPFDGGGSNIPDKLVHFLIFAALAGTGRLAGIRITTLAVVLVAYAVTTEILQGMLPFGRTSDWRDAVADTAGMIAGMLSAQFLLLISGGSAFRRAAHYADEEVPGPRR